MIFREETDADIPLIRAVTEAAFANAKHSSGAEAAIIEGLRRSGALSLSLVAESGGAVVGHVGFSPVLIQGQALGWFGLGPLSVEPRVQGRGVGTRLVREGLRRLIERGAAGCVVLGDPAYYGRFGFTSDHDIRFGSVPQKYFQSLVLTGDALRGEVTYHPAFAGG